MSSKARGRIPPFTIIGGFILLLAGFFGGLLYERALMENTMAQVHLHDLILRYHDWQRFSEHVREDRKRFGNARVPFPSDVALSRHNFVIYPPPAPGKTTRLPQAAALQAAPVKAPKLQPALQTVQVNPPLFQTRASDIRLISNDGMQAKYAIHLELINKQVGNEILSPEDIKIEDQNGRYYSAYSAAPQLPDSGIPSQQSFQSVLYFLVPTESVPEKLTVISSTIELIPPFSPSMKSHGANP